MKTAIKIIVLLFCFAHAYGQQRITSIVLNNSDDSRLAGIEVRIEVQIENSSLAEEYTFVMRDNDRFSGFLDRILASRTQAGVDETTINEVGKGLAINYVCWIEIEEIDFVRIRLVRIGTNAEIVASARGRIEGQKLVITGNRDGFLDCLMEVSPPPPPPNLTISDFIPLGLSHFSRQNRQIVIGVCFLVTQIGFGLLSWHFFDSFSTNKYKHSITDSLNANHLENNGWNLVGGIVSAIAAIGSYYLNVVSNQNNRKYNFSVQPATFQNSGATATGLSLVVNF